MARKVHWEQAELLPQFWAPQRDTQSAACLPAVRESRRIRAEGLSKADAPHQAALTHLGFCLKLHLHLLPVRG